MEVNDTRGRWAIDDACAAARRELGWLAFHAGMTALLVAMAVHGLDGIAPALLWFAAGGLAADTATSVRQTWQARKELRALGRCETCRLAAVEQDAVWSRQARCIRSGHSPAVAR